MRDVVLGGVRLHQEIDVPVNSTTMRLGVEDIANSHVGTLEIPLPLKAPPDAPIATHRSVPAMEPDLSLAYGFAIFGASNLNHR